MSPMTPITVRRNRRPTPRPEVARMHGYTPGEQPKDPLLVKLNTNENNYPPAPGVIAALRSLTEQRVSRYPDPMCTALRASIARDLDLAIDQVLMGNGSDEVLKMVMEAYVDPHDRVGYLWPTYSLYPVFVEKHEATEVRFPWDPNGRTQEEALDDAPTDLKLAYITNPNPPLGLPVALEAIRRFAEQRPSTLVVVDEAYIAYGGESAVALVREGVENVAVTRTFSKSHSLAGMRVGFIAGPAYALELLYRIKDSYNLDVAAQVAALAAWDDAAYTQGVVAKIKATRDRLAESLRGLGFRVVPSAGNFLFARREDAPELYRLLRENHILVRYFNTPELRDGIRISIGTDAEIDALLAVIRSAVPVGGTK